MVALQWWTWGHGLDPHWTTSWGLLWWGLLALLVTGDLELDWSGSWVDWGWLSGLLLLLGLYLIGPGDSPEALLFHVTLWIALRLRPRWAGLGWLASLRTVTPIVGLVMAGLLGGWALSQMALGRWGHAASYALVLPWAHRNMAMESLLFMFLLGRLKWPAWRWAWWAGMAGLAAVYQVRGVLLSMAVWAAIELLFTGQAGRTLRRISAGAIGVFILAQVAWNVQPVEQRVSTFARLPDVVKAFDVMYNLRAARSSTDRLLLWDWTVRHIPAMGEGSGSWKWNAQCEVNQIMGDCTIAVRRAHSDLLQLAFELGWLGLLLLGGIVAWMARVRGRWVWVVVPLLLFTFPTERAETLWPFLLVWWAGGKESDSGSETGSRAPRWKWPVVLVCLLLASFGTMWSWSQDRLGALVQGKIGVTELSSTDRQVLDWFPSDIAMNHIDVLVALRLHAAGRDEQALGLIESHLDSHPNSMTASQLQAKLLNAPLPSGQCCGPGAE